MPFFAAAAAAVLIVGAGAYSCSKHDNNDRLSDGQASGTREATAAGTTGAATADPARRCASTRTYDLLKRELFRRAAQIRGNADPALFDRIALAAALRVERPLVTSSDEGLGSIACSASAAIDLPPGLAVAGGRTTLAADLGYTLQPAADGSGDVLAFTNADAIAVPLATIGRTSAGIPPSTVPQAIPPADYIPSPASPNPPPPPAPVVVHRPTPTPAPVQAPVADPVASPSFSCARARTRGEIALCGDPGLAAIDRQMATQYRSAYAAASPAAQVALRTTAHRFYGFRDNCPDARCIASGYRQRMREIDDIMARDER